MNIIITVILLIPSVSYSYTHAGRVVKDQQGSKKKCESNLLPDLHDCHKFYACMETLQGTMDVPFACPKGTVFNPKIQSCLNEDPKEPCRPVPSSLFRDSKVTADKCSKSGSLTCKGCAEFGLCVDNQYQYYNCISGTYCDKKSGMCKADVRECESNPFQCGEEGVFPDTNSCTKYHICDKDLKDTPRQCPYGKAFNSGSLLCDLPITDPVACFKAAHSICTGKESSLEKKGLESDCLLYYRCLISNFNPEILTPVYFRCPFSKAFVTNSNVTKNKCDDISKIPPPDHPTCYAQLIQTGVLCLVEGWNVRDSCVTKAYNCSSSLNVVYTISCDNGQAIDISKKPYTCKGFKDTYCMTLCNTLSAEGIRREKNIDDCTKYFQCDSSDGLPKEKTCPEGSVFNGALEKCDAPENVPRCKTSPSTVTYSPVTATTAASPFKCTRQGMFQDPNSCDSYILCLQNGSGFQKSVHRCPSHYIFGKNEGYCILGTCSN